MHDLLASVGPFPILAPIAPIIVAIAALLNLGG
jgi:hypothetical protein